VGLGSIGIELDAGMLQGFASKLPVGTVIGQVTGALVDGLSNTFLVLIFVIYLLQGQSSDVERASLAVELEGRIKRYLSIKFLLSGVTGLLVGILLAVLGVELALVFGIFAFILNFIPSVGSIIATLLPLPLVLVEPDSTAIDIVLVLLLPGGVQMVVGNILEPKLLGDSLELHPITILLCLIFWGMLWGIPGMLLAAPITAVLKILFEHLEVTAPLGRLLAGDVNALFEGTGESAEPVTDPLEAESSRSEVS
jgi:AI-2 transport protein TqsA